MAIEGGQTPAAPSLQLAEARSPSAAPDPANVYDYLIGSEEDVVGLVAYAVYKQEKREWLATWRRQNNAEPSSDHFSAFVSANLTTGQRQRYRTAARQVLDSYVANDYDGQGNPQRGSAEIDRIDAVVHQIEGRGGWLQGLWAGAAGAAVVLIAVGLVLFALHIGGLGLFGPAGVAQ